MKLLLTSDGLTNKSIENALEKLVGKPRKEMRIAFIPNAAFPEDENKHQPRNWLVDDLFRIKEFCGFIDVISLTDLSKDNLLNRLEYCDVIFVGGGNTFYLSYCMEASGLFELLPELLETRVYAGISAGSMIATASLRTTSQAIKNKTAFYDEEYGEFGPDGKSSAMTAQLVDFVVRPHFNSFTFPNVQGDFLSQIAEDVRVPLYAIDDNSAVMVNGQNIQIISEGQYKVFNA
jgi:dipeptidase E